MDDDSGVQFLTARSRKRPHHQMSASSSHRGHSSRHRPDGPSSSQASSSRRRLPPLPPTRYAGDGLDFRRPVMSSNEQEAVIDLTNEPDSSPPRTRQQRSPNRPPRFGRDILSEHEVVDLVDEPDYSENRDPPSSPEVQVVGATTRPRLPPPPPQPRAPSLNRTTFFNLLRSADLWPTPLLDFGALDTVFLGQSGRPVDDPTLNLNEPGPSRGPQRSAYKPPSPPPEGFTRTAGEEDIVVCPNCESELGIGSDQKQEVWIAKQCGHAYCGECARNRALSKSKKSVQKTKPFSKCQVPDCGKSVSSPKSMVQVYL